jgi:hypothetical protein
MHWIPPWVPLRHCLLKLPLKMSPGRTVPKASCAVLCCNHSCSAPWNDRALYRVFTFLQAPCILETGPQLWNSEILSLLPPPDISVTIKATDKHYWSFSVTQGANVVRGKCRELFLFAEHWKIMMNGYREGSCSERLLAIPETPSLLSPKGRCQWGAASG